MGREGASARDLPASNQFPNQFFSLLLLTFLHFNTIFLCTTYLPHRGINLYLYSTCERKYIFLHAYFTFLPNLTNHKGEHLKLHSTVGWSAPFNAFLICHSQTLSSQALFCRKKTLLMSPFTPYWTGPPTSPFLPNSKVMRAVIDQLFQQEMRGHLSEACLNSQFTRLRSCSRTAFYVTRRPALPTQPTWVILPCSLLISEVLLACKYVHVQRNNSTWLCKGKNSIADWHLFLTVCFYDAERCNLNAIVPI